MLIRIARQREMVLLFFIAKLRITESPQEYLRNHFEGGSISLDEKKKLLLSRNQFYQMHANFHFPIQCVELFNEIFSSFVCTLEFRRLCASSIR